MLRWAGVSREKIAELLAQYRQIIEGLERSRRTMVTRLQAVNIAMEVATKSEDRLVEEADAKMKAGGLFASTTGAGAAALLVKFGLVVCPSLILPIVGGIIAGRALSSRSETRRLFNDAAADHAEQKVSLEAELARLDQELKAKREKLARVEVLWKKVR
jgi:hypothetical protein